MTFSDQKKLANHIMRLLKVRQVSFPIVLTEKGSLSFKYTKDEETCQMVLDAIPLPTASIMTDENNMELQKLLTEHLFEKDGDDFTEEIGA